MTQRFDAETTWRASGNGVFQFTSPGNVTLPYGRAYITVRGKGADGSSPYTTPGLTPGTVPGTTPNATSPGVGPGTVPNTTSPGQVPDTTPNATSPGVGPGTVPNATSPGTVPNTTTPNTTSPGQTPFTTPNATTPYQVPATGIAGQPTSVLGVNFPGGAISQAATPVAATEINYYNFPVTSNTGTAFPVSVPLTGAASITVEID